jgi:trans-aconitate methyltransferase
MPEQQITHSGHEDRDQELFGQISDKYCQKDLHYPSRLARRQRLLHTLRSAPSGLNGDLLEIGCGAGFAVPYLENRFESYCGVDYADNLIRYAQAHNAGPGVEFVTANLKDFDPGRQFDLIFAIGVLHHLDDLDSALRHVVGLLKPGGWLAVNEPHPGNPLVSLARRCRKKVDSQYSDEQTEMTATQLREAYEAAGLQNIGVFPQGLFSTPFAEVAVKPQFLTVPMSAAACLMDKVCERTLGPVLRRVSWNLIAVGQRPGDDA